MRLYEERLQAEYGLYYRVARAFVRAISRPPVMRACTLSGMQSRSLMEWLLRIMSNMLRPDEMGPAEAAYKAVAAMARAKTRPLKHSAAAAGSQRRRARRARLAEGLHRALEVGVAVGQAREQHLVRPRGDGHSPLQQAVHDRRV